jgi:lysophospholipase
MPSDTSLVSLARNPVPGGAVEGLVSTADGVHLRYATWLATREPLRGTCVIVQGRSEYIEKYFETVADLRRRGYGVIAFDFRGQGGSERLLADPTRGHVNSFRDYDMDLEGIIRDVLPTMPAPYLALGHSLGGHILLRHALADDSPFSRLVVTGPMIRLADAALGMPARSARMMAEMVCAAGFGSRFVPGGKARPKGGETFVDNPLTRDRERYMRAQAVLDAGPHLAIGSPTFGWMRAAFRSMAILQAPDTPRLIRLPTLFVAAGDDRVVSTTAVEEFALKTKLGSAVLLAAARHEILQENDDTRTRFWSAFDAYLSAGDVAA